MSPKRRAIPPPAEPPVVVEGLEPLVDGGRFPAKAVVGDRLAVRADVFAHGHDLVRAFLRQRPAGSGESHWQLQVMAPLGNDRFEGVLVPGQPGRLEVEVLGEVDQLAGWRRDAARRVQADQLDPNDLATGTTLLRGAARRLAGARALPRELGEPGQELARPGAEQAAEQLRLAADRLRQARTPRELEEVLALLERLAPVLDRRPPDSSQLASASLPLAVQRELAACSAWYECFPRSTSPEPGRHGTLRDLIGRLDYVAGLGFDLLYLPPVHPIGRTARKGPNNSPQSGPDDVGSPWAIGSAEGGHLAIAPELGTLEDFAALVTEAGERGLELALDLAFQCSPDHPWVHEHPGWFAHRPDGTIACAENPPKRYEDVYPIDFTTADREALYLALLEVVRTWVARGVRVFRVDNPHTKPFAFWEWLIATVHEEDPGVVFLAEAFTRPKVMHRLAKLGFDQSYTYFTWRDDKWELEQYLLELAVGPGAAYFRGNLWPNTPDILARSLQRGGRPSFVARLVLAACGSANYGIYGPLFELLADRPVRPGSEEYLDSEKYQLRHFDLEDPRSIAAVVRRVNAARRLHPALRRNGSLRLHQVDNPALVCWSKRDREKGDTVCCVVNLDPDWPQSGFLELDLAALGLEPDTPFAVRDLLDDATYTWSGSRNFVLLDPARGNVHVLAVEAAADAGPLR